MCHVMIVDDNSDLLDIWVRAFKRAGFDVTHAPDGRLACQQFTQVRPDVLVTDYHMPGANGYDVVRALRALPDGSESVVIMITADHNARMATHADLVDLFLLKPVSYGDMVTLAQRLSSSMQQQP